MVDEPRLLGRPLSISCYWFRNRPLAEVVQHIADEFGVRSLGLWPHLLVGQSTAQIEDALAQGGATAYCLNVPGDHRFNQPGTETEAARVLREAIQLAADLHVPLVQVYAGTNPSLSADENVRAYAEQLRPHLEFAAAHGVTIALENNLDHRGEDPNGVNPSRRPERLRMLAELVDRPNFGLVFDSCNFHTVGVEPFPAAYEQLAPWIVSVEFKDVVRFDERQHGTATDRLLLNDSITGRYVPVAVGDGAVHPGQLLDRLADDGYAGVLAIDPYAVGDTLVRDTRASIDFLQRHARQQVAPVGLAREGTAR